MAGDGGCEFGAGRGLPWDSGSGWCWALGGGVIRGSLPWGRGKAARDRDLGVAGAWTGPFVWARSGDGDWECFTGESLEANRGGSGGSDERSWGSLQLSWLLS